MIYFLQPTDGGPIKIGYSADVDARHRQLEAHYGKPLSLLAMVDGDRRTEAEIHRRFAAHRLGKTEQFKPAREILEFIGRPLLVGANPEAVEAMPVSVRSVKLHMDVIETARIVSAYRNETLTDMLGNMLRPLLTRMEQEEVAKRSKTAEAPKKERGAK